MLRGSANDGRSLPASQRGAALLLALFMVGLLIALFVVVLVNDLVRDNTRRQQTAEALAKAKEALIGAAAGVDLEPARPGDLPCPDLDDDGIAESSCGNAAGTTGQPNRLGRLPWRTLGLPDLRDGDGERLWYAVSNNFKINTRTICSNPGNPGCLNSSTPGTITLSDRDGTIIHDGSDPNPPSGIIAVIISPGAIVQRDGAANPQDRSCAGGACLPAGDTAGICSSANPISTAKCNPVNFLDAVGGGEDNADFVDGSTDGFMTGPVLAADGRQIVNDSILPIKYEDLMPLLERRVAKEALNCLNAYANYPTPGASASSHNRYPWASSVANSTGATYPGERTYRFGRLPDTFGESLLGIIPTSLPGTLGEAVVSVCGLVPGLCLSDGWPPSAGSPACSIPGGGQGWWLNWKDSVFYGVAPDYQPASPGLLASVLAIVTQYILNPLGLAPLFTAPAAPAACGTPGTCMTVNPPSSTAGRKLVVAVAGRPLAGQQRLSVADRQNITNYLESSNGANLGGPTPPNFTVQPAGPTFNDYLLYQ